MALKQWGLSEAYFLKEIQGLALMAYEKVNAFGDKMDKDIDLTFYYKYQPT